MNDLLHMLVTSLDDESSEVRTVCAEGLAKLLFSQRISSSKILSRLLVSAALFAKGILHVFPIILLLFSGFLLADDVLFCSVNGKLSLKSWGSWSGLQLGRRFVGSPLWYLNATLDWRRPSHRVMTTLPYWAHHESLRNTLLVHPQTNTSILL